MTLRVGVIGAGTMGTGITYAFAAKGCATTGMSRTTAAWWMDGVLSQAAELTALLAADLARRA